MTTYIRTIKDKDGNIIVPRTRVEAVLQEDGVTSISEILDISLVFKGTVATYLLLPSSDLKVGDMYYVTADEVHYFWNGSVWATVGSGTGGGEAVDINLTDTLDYYTSTDVEGALAEVGESLETVIFYGDGAATDPVNIFSAVDEDILPTQDITYDLGSATKRWKDLYLSSNSIHLGDTTLSIENGSFTVSDSIGDPIPIDAATLNGYSSDDFAKPIDITNAISNLVDTAPTALDTLNELAAALGDDANYAATVTTALAAKAPLANPTFTGTVSGISAAMVGLGNVNNTSDLNKPISSAIQIALDAKANKSTITTTTLLASNWVGSSAPYTYSLTVSGVTSTSNQELIPTVDITNVQLNALLAANIQDAGQSINTISLKSFGTKPTIDLPIRIILRGDI